MIGLPADYNDLTQDQRREVRQRYISVQKGKCYHCGCSLVGDASGRIRKLPINKELFPKTFFKYPIHLHHSHSTGMTIGAVHNYCNAVLWQYHNE
ncbi:MAG: hypothetical protein KAH32_07270 [Chlamydiia bacterium]|nr:hypothetical protein [Chlamydiia bacterium]